MPPFSSVKKMDSVVLVEFEFKYLTSIIRNIRLVRKQKSNIDISIVLTKDSNSKTSIKSVQYKFYFLELGPTKFRYRQSYSSNTWVRINK